ncbi:protein kinase [Hamiltosporidium tvaerminnensis]|uniref:non-specific serine/threonine protein kinase n=2 Tax=Hamiltosporidium TaxID=1176354 RepID=A0A4V2JX41_9MICR|nr:protein kinase [Hamiltosporidium tvaerminnensis]
MKILAQGAEAKILLIENIIVKERIPKLYRPVELDNEIRFKRTRQEKKIVDKLYQNSILVPKIVKPLQNFDHKTTLFMEYIEGSILKDFLCQIEKYKDNFNKSEHSDSFSIKITKIKNIMFRLGETIQKMHKLNIIHGDLTTSNFILKKEDLYIIDFGLSYFSTKEEDKAVDLYLFEKAIRCTHPEFIIDYFYEGYTDKIVLNRLIEVRKRGRKRELNSMG